MTSSKYQLCSYHYRRQWALLKDKRVNSMYEHPHLLQEIEQQ